MPDLDHFTPQDRVLDDDTLAKIMAIGALMQNPGRSWYPQNVEYEYLRAKSLILEYRQSRPDSK